MKLLGEKGIWLSVQTLEEAPPTASANTKAKKHMVVEGTDNAFRWAKKYSVTLAWGPDLMFVPGQMTNQNTDIVKLKAWMTPAEALRLVTHDNFSTQAACWSSGSGRSGNAIETPPLAAVNLRADGDPSSVTDVTPVTSLTKKLRPGHRGRIA